MSQNYEQNATAAKLAARDIQRTRWTINLLEERRAQEMSLKNIDKLIEQEEKRLAIAEFKTSQAKKEGDPRAADYEKDLEPVQKEVKEALKRAEEDRKDIKESIAAINKKIADVQSGELKVEHSKTVETAKELLFARVSKEYVEGDYDGQTE